MRIERRPRHILAVYIEARRLELVRAERRRRSWLLEPPEQHLLPEGESLYDSLSRLNLRPKASHSTALILFLPRSYYSFGREYYPLTLQDRLEEALTFDWQENLFHDDEHTLRFAAMPVVGERQLVVPIFSLSLEVYEKFQQALGAALFGSFTIIPSALAYPAVLDGQAQGNGQSAMRMLARLLGPSEMEVHRYLNGAIVDSFLVHRQAITELLFHEMLRALATDNETEAGDQPYVELLCSPAEEAEEGVRSWIENGLAIRSWPIEGSLLSRWVQDLVAQERARAFGSELRLRPWQPPRILLPLVLALACYGVFGAYQGYTCKKLARTAIEVQNQRKQLEAQWKPIEQLQTNISKLKEQHKALAEFDQQSMPVYELLNQLTQVTTEDTWLDFFSLTNKELQIRGESKSAAKYLSELSKVDGFTNVSFASPVSRNPSSDKERFNVRILFDIDRLRKTLVVNGAGSALEGDESGAALEVLPMGMDSKAAPSAPGGGAVVPQSRGPERTGVGNGEASPMAQETPPGAMTMEPPPDDNHGGAEPEEVQR